MYMCVLCGIGRLAVAAGGLVSAAAAVSSVALGLPMEVAAGSFTVSSLGTGIMYWWVNGPLLWKELRIKLSHSCGVR